MRKSNVKLSADAAVAAVESLESRALFAASFDVLAALQAAGHRTIGPTDGSTASAVGPVTTGISPDIEGGPNNVNRDAAIKLAIVLGTGGGVKETSLHRLQFRIYRQGQTVANSINTGNVQTSGGGDVLLVKPVSRLAASTTYVVAFNQDTTVGKITDVSGNEFPAATYTFTTGTDFNAGDPDIKFQQTNVVNKTTNGSFSSTAIGPDGRLYAGTLQGYIYSWAIADNGTLTDERTYGIVRTNNGNAARFITGLTFDPRSNPDKPVLWVSHGQAKFGDTAGHGSGSQYYADNYTGKISRLYGTDFTTYEDAVINIPRSVKDHLNNQIAFDPIAKNLYFVIPSMSAMGAADTTWGSEPETLTTASLVRLQLRSKGTVVGIEEYLQQKGPVDLGPSGGYNIYKGSNPLRFYATGIRNAYDMVFHSNGHLYLPSNGSAAGGNTPTDPNQAGTGINSLQQTIDDYLFDIVEGGYYGHPNPVRGEYILHGGNPTASGAQWKVPSYPSGTEPDDNYRGAVFSFGKNQSPDGVIEYKGNAFGGKLKGSLIVARYSSGQDLVAIKPRDNATFSLNDEKVGISGFTGFIDNGTINAANPLDLVEDPRTGRIYVVSLGTKTGKGAITLLTPRADGSQASTDQSRVSVYVTPGDRDGFSKTVRLINTGSVAITVDRSATKITGTNRKNFVVTDLPAADFTLQPGEWREFTMKGVLASGSSGPAYGNLAFATDNPSQRYTVVQLRAFDIGGTASSVAPAQVVTESGARPLSAVASATSAKASFSATRIGSELFGVDDEAGQVDVPLV